MGGKTIRKGQAIKAESPIPPGVVGYDPNYRASYHYDPVLANKLLDYFGYKRGADGFRTQPDGKPLVITRWSTPEAITREYDELWKKSLDAIANAAVEQTYQPGQYIMRQGDTGVGASISRSLP